MSSRRSFIKKASLAGIAGITTPTFASAEELSSTPNKRPKVLFFDVNETLLDLTAMKTNVSNALNGNTDLLKLWFTTMLQYSLVTTVTRQYDDFGKIGAAALVMVAANNNIKISQKEAENIIIPPLRSLPPHPEVIEALELLKKNNYTLVSFTNSSQKGVSTQFKNAGLTHYFDKMLSIDALGKFKPHHETYAWASRQMNIEPSESMLIAAHGWDIAGALAAGWRAAFVNRPGAQLYPLAPSPELNEFDLSRISKKLINL
ncbi:haloacid dehalogenase type II [Neptunitalea lumnitzerae]|nr:haloacid dehalogenase type II [Neptunitalea sp. Y10]